MGSRGKGPRLGGGSGGGLGGPTGSPQSRLWRRLGTGEPWSFSFATLSGLPEPGAELGKDRRSGSVVGGQSPSQEPASGLERFDAEQSRARESKGEKDPHGGGVEGRHRRRGAGPGLRPLHFHPHLPLTLFHPSYPSPRCRKGRCSQKAEESQGSGGTYWGADFPAGEKIRGGSVRVRGQEVTEKPSPTRAQGADLTQHQTPTPSARESGEQGNTPGPCRGLEFLRGGAYRGRGHK